MQLLHGMEEIPRDCAWMRAKTQHFLREKKKKKKKKKKAASSSSYAVTTSRRKE